MISADVARGDGADYSAFHVIDTQESEVVAEFKCKIPPDQFAVVLAEAGKRYNNATLVPESNTYGYAVLMKLKELEYPAIYFAKEKDRFAVMYGNGNIGKGGFSTSGVSRPKILTKLEEVIRNKQITIRSSRLYEELKTFIWKGQKAQAMRGKNDDLVISLAIGIWLYDTSASYSQHSVDLNAAMLAAMGVNKSGASGVLDPRVKTLQNVNPFKPIILEGSEQNAPATPENPFADFLWLLK